jgi:ketosteroid isomerase-like protein
MNAKLLVLAAVAGLLPAQDSAMEAVRARQSELEQALVQADVAKLDRMLTADFLRTPPGGRNTDKAAYSAILASGQLKYISFENSEQKYRVYGDTVLLTEMSKIRTRSGQRAESETTLRLLWVWVKRNGEWLLAGVEGTNA